jgi:hypothetical protein
MSQQLINQELTAGGGGNTTTSSGKTGSTVLQTGLYKASDNKTQFIELLEQGQLFPPYPGGNGTSKCTWTRMTTATEGSKTSFDSVLVDAGTA